MVKVKEAYVRAVICGSFYDLGEGNVEEYAHEFFTKEYQLDYEIHQYPKPIVAYITVLLWAVVLDFQSEQLIGL